MSISNLIAELNTEVTEAVRVCRLLTPEDLRALAAVLGVPPTVKALQLECMGSRHARMELWSLLFNANRSRTPPRRAEHDAPRHCPPAPRVPRRMESSPAPSFSPKGLMF
jgi:hypothetical protein